MTSFMDAINPVTRVGAVLLLATPLLVSVDVVSAAVALTATILLAPRGDAVVTAHPPQLAHSRRRTHLGTVDGALWTPRRNRIRQLPLRTHHR